MNKKATPGRNVVLSLTVVATLMWFLWPRLALAPTTLEGGQLKEEAAVAKSVIPTRTPELVEPADDFRARVTEKPFGIYITPETSPVQPERFRGYHTGADAEYGDVASDVPVRAAADGTILLARTASGYGGVVAIQHVVAGEQTVGIYGHLRPSSLPDVGTKVTAGQRIGVLGSGDTAETDGERKHLHFGLVKGTVANLHGYVSTEAELSDWLNPLF